MEAGEFAGEVEAEAVAGDIFADDAAVEALENVPLCGGGNSGTGVADGEFDEAGVQARGDTDASVGTVIFAGVLEEILENERGVAGLGGDEEREREIGFDGEAGSIGERAEIVHGGGDEVREIDGGEFETEAACVETGKQKEIFDDAGEPVGLVNKRGDRLALRGTQMVVREEFLEAGTEDGDGGFELVRGVGGEAGGALEFLVRGLEGGERAAWRERG